MIEKLEQLLQKYKNSVTERQITMTRCESEIRAYTDAIWNLDSVIEELKRIKVDSKD